jgi:hypothetical protein
MSDIPFSPAGLGFREQVARIDRMIAGTGKLNEETRKFVAGAQKLNRDHGLAPWVVTIGIIGGVLGIVGFAAGAFGLLP